MASSYNLSGNPACSASFSVAVRKSSTYVYVRVRLRGLFKSREWGVQPLFLVPGPMRLLHQVHNLQGSKALLEVKPGGAEPVRARAVSLMGDNPNPSSCGLATPKFSASLPV